MFLFNNNFSYSLSSITIDSLAPSIRPLALTDSGTLSLFDTLAVESSRPDYKGFWSLFLNQTYSGFQGASWVQIMMETTMKPRAAKIRGVRRTIWLLLAIDSYHNEPSRLQRLLGPLKFLSLFDKLHG